MCPGHFQYQTIDMLLDFLTNQKFWNLHDISLVNDTLHTVIFLEFDINLRFPWSTTHGMPLYFLYYSKIWHLHWSMIHGMLLLFLYCSEIWHLHEMQSSFLNFDIYMRFTVVFLCEKCNEICLVDLDLSKWIVALHCFDW